MHHLHHIIPRYQGGGDEPENLVKLTVTQHAMWHFAEWQRKGNIQDKGAWKMLTGTPPAEALSEMNSRNGQMAMGVPKPNARGKTRKYSEETRCRMSKSAKKRWANATPEELLKMSPNLGKKLSAETKAKISAKRRLQKPPNKKEN